MARSFFFFFGQVLSANSGDTVIVLSLLKLKNYELFVPLTCSPSLMSRYAVLLSSTAAQYKISRTVNITVEE